MDQRKSFGSDNHAGAHEAVVRALAQANAADVPGYGDDPWTEWAAAALSTTFGARGGAYFVFTGTAANILGLSLLLRPYEGVICAETAHINVDECGAPERILGSKLLTVATSDGKLTPELIGSRLGDRGDEHRAQPRVVAISQVTELGTCYSLAELKSLGEFCRAEGVAGMPGVHLWQPVESNAVFASLDPAHVERLQRDWHFYIWDAPAHVVRWMTAFNTTEADVDAFLADVRRTAGGRTAGK